MNWISTLWRKPAAKPVAPPAPRRSPPPPPADDIEALRRALIAAVGDAALLLHAAADLGRALAGRGQAPQPDDPPGVWVAAICQVADKALALAWTASLDGDAWLGEVAARGRFSEVRLAALQRIEDAAVLEIVAQANRDKDKRVYRGCTDRLRQRRQADADARRALQLADALRRLLEVAPMHLSHLLELEKEVHALGAAAQTGASCQALLDQAHARLQQESAALRDLKARKAAAELLLKECADVAAVEPARFDDWRCRLETLAQAQLGLAPWLAGQAPAKMLDDMLRAIESRLAALASEAERVLACEQFIAAHEAVAADADADAAAESAAAWAALAKPQDAATRQSLESRWQALQAPPVLAAVAAEPPPPPPPPPVAIDHAAVRPLLAKLEGAVEQGQLGEAEAAAKALDAALGGHSLRGELESRWQRATAQLAELRGWARWGTGQAREHLIAAAEQVSQGSPSVDELAEGVQKLRDQWKRLNAHGPASKEQWVRFDALLTQAYQPVAARNSEEAVKQAAAREVKEAWCAEWESWLAAIAAEPVDYKTLEDRRQAMTQQWRGAGHAGFRDERLLRKRFDKLLKSLDQRLEAMRAAELERREQLIAAAAGLREVPDLGRAIREAKALQERWSRQAIAPRLTRGEEQKLWQRFRGACAEVFARRDAQNAQQAQQREERTQAVRGLMEAFAASLADDDVDAVKRALHRFRADWDAARVNSRDLADGLDARMRELQQQAQRRIETLLRAQHNAQFELLAQKAALADAVEAAAIALAPTPEVAAKAQQAWDALPCLPGKAENPLAERFARAAYATAEQLDSGREARETMLIDLEILLALPSPEACAEARRRRQLERLQHRFGTGVRQSRDAEALLVHWYATPAAPDAALDQRMTEVKRVLLEQADALRAGKEGQA